MKAIGVVGSPRKNGNTEILTKHTLKAVESGKWVGLWSWPGEPGRISPSPRLCIGFT